MKKAFTLAEALVTVVIIGVIASLTIPTLLFSNMKNEYYTLFMRSYNIVTDAVNTKLIDDGSPESWLDSNTVSPNTNQLLGNYLNITKVCEVAFDGNCFAQKYTNLTATRAVPVESGNAVMLSNGATVMLTDISNSLVKIHVDTNGAKGPNRFGVDFFALFYDFDGMISNAYAFSDDYPGINITCTPGTGNDSGRQGAGCAKKVLMERNMDYIENLSRATASSFENNYAYSDDYSSDYSSGYSSGYSSDYSSGYSGYSSGYSSDYSSYGY